MPKVFLSAGHGAVGNGLKEKIVNLNVLLGCKSELEKYGINIVCSRTTDENDPINQEVKEAMKKRNWSLLDLKQ